MTPQEGAIPLAVDLDGTLCPVDTFHESALLLLSRTPWRLPRMIAWLREGKAGFKARLAAEAVASADTLPVREEVLDLIRQAKAAGRPVWLVSAADQRQVEAVAAHVGLFDRAIGSNADRNLAGRKKADFLVSQFGAGGFDYAGDSSVDLAVWEKARRAITVSASDRTRRRADGLAVELDHLVDRPGRLDRLRAYLRALRPQMWIANLLVLVPVILAPSPSALLQSMVAFLAFCLATSAACLIDDLLSLDADRRHPHKRRRPLAAAQIPASHGVVLTLMLLLAAFALSLSVTPQVAELLAGYIALCIGYSVGLKRHVTAGTLLLAAFYTSRILAGAAASQVVLPAWLLVLSILLCLGLAAILRRSDLGDLSKQRAQDRADHD